MINLTEAYQQHVLSLFPQGQAWSRDPGSTLGRVVKAVGAKLADADLRAQAGVGESDPRQSTELLTDWEHTCGLPDGCLGTAEQTMAERRAQVVARVTARGGQSPAYFKSLAQALGYDVDIVEYSPFVAGGDAGTPCHDETWRHAWSVQAPFFSIRYFASGGACAGEPLATWGNDILECAITRHKPAQSCVLFSYI